MKNVVTLLQAKMKRTDAKAGIRAKRRYMNGRAKQTIKMIATKSPAMKRTWKANHGNRK